MKEKFAGLPRIAWFAIVGAIGLLFMGCLCLLVMGIISANNPPTSQTESTSGVPPSAATPYKSVPSGAHRISGDGWFGCSDRDYFDKLIGYVVDKDTEAFRKALSDGVLVGNCSVFENGESVYLIDTAILSGLVKIRRQGETQEFWTNIEAVK